MPCRGTHFNDHSKCIRPTVPGLNRVCKKLKIDCAQAVIGFDFHQGSCHAAFDGFVVCEEFADQVVKQYWLDKEESERAQVEKYEARVYGNWKKLIKGLMIRAHLQRKYKFADDDKKPKDEPKAKEEKKTTRGRK